MDKQLKQKWVKALRSGEYEQGASALLTLDNGIRSRKFCCLGVLCDVINPQGWNAQGSHELEDEDESYISTEGLVQVGLSDDEQRELGGMNDEGISFRAIADFIESDL